MLQWTSLLLGSVRRNSDDQLGPLVLVLAARGVGLSIIVLGK